SPEIIDILIGARQGKKDPSLSIREKRYVLALRITAAGRAQEKCPPLGSLPIDGDKRREILGLLHQLIAAERPPVTQVQFVELLNVDIARCVDDRRISSGVGQYERECFMGPTL